MVSCSSRPWRSRPQPTCISTNKIQMNLNLSKPTPLSPQINNKMVARAIGTQNGTMTRMGLTGTSRTAIIQSSSSLQSTCLRRAATGGSLRKESSFPSSPLIRLQFLPSKTPLSISHILYMETLDRYLQLNLLITQ